MSKVVKRRVLGRSPRQKRMVDFFSNPETKTSKESALCQAEKKITKPVATVLVVRCVVCWDGDDFGVCVSHMCLWMVSWTERFCEWKPCFFFMLFCFVRLFLFYLSCFLLIASLFQIVLLITHLQCVSFRVTLRKILILTYIKI